MENYIIIAHPIDFVYLALEGFFKRRGVTTYRLETDDDIQYRVGDLSPCACLIHKDFCHQDFSLSELFALFPDGVSKYSIGVSIDSALELVEPIEPHQLVNQIMNDLESQADCN